MTASAYAYAALPSFTVRTPKVAVFWIATRAMGQVRAVNPTMTWNVNEQEFNRVGDDATATVETSVKDDHTMTVDLYERGLDQKELKLLLGKTEVLTGSITLSSSVTPFDCSIAVYASNTVGGEPEVNYLIDDFKPRTWAITNDAQSKDLLHRFTGVHSGMSWTAAT